MPTIVAAIKRKNAAKLAEERSLTSRGVKALGMDNMPIDIFALIGKSENIEQAALAMQAMSHPMRIKILCLLSSGELIVQEIVDALGTTQSNISQHLGILKACGMINGRKDGTKMYYNIGDARILKMITLTREIFCAG